MRRAFALALAITLVSAASCGGDDGEKIAPERLARIVLQPADVGRAFDQFDEGKLVRADMHPGPRADDTRFGHQGGWKARYKRAGSATARGPLVVESRADVFEDAGGAKKDLAAYRAEFESEAATLGGATRLVEVPQVGEQTVARTLGQGTGSFAVRFYTVAWRYRNATASVLVQGFHGKIALRDALSLARKQQRRLVRASR